MTEPGGPQTALTYDPQRHQLDTVSAPGGVALDVDFDGPLATQEAMSGPVSATSSRTYDSSFRVAETRVNGAHAVSFGYDDDRLLTSAGALSLTRDPQSGFVSSTTVEQLGDATTYNPYPDTYTATHGSTTLYSVDYERDDAGRIAEKTETTPSGTHTIAYAYDDVRAFRLPSRPERNPREPFPPTSPPRDVPGLGG